MSEAKRLRDAVVEGKLDVRADLANVGEEFRPFLAGVNDTMDAYAKPFAVTVDYVTRISNGDIPPPITDGYEGDFNQLKEALNRCIAALSGLVSDGRRVAVEQEKGDIEALVDASRYKGAYNTLASGVNAGLQIHIRNILEILEIVRAYAEGDFSPVLRRLPGKQIIANERMDLLRNNLRTVSSEVQALTRAAVDGKLVNRVDIAPFRGDWKKLVEGVNAILDAVIVPLNVAAKCVAQISRGEIPPKITDAYVGDFNTIKENLNTCVDAVDLLVADAGKLVEAAVAGQLSTRADATKHQGDFRKIVEGVNQTLDAVMAPINEAAGVLEQLAQRDLRARVAGNYQGDHARIKESINATGEALHDALAQVTQAVDQVSSASTQIAASSQAVASGASEQAASLEETTSSLESVSSMTKQAADNAQHANELAKAARTAATDGSTAVDQMQRAMGNIRASAEGTSQIIKDINDIAFQTNLLALNAAVEAARAGEAGRGFAVVAEEVRSLALRAKEAATKTEELIRQSVKEAVQGEVTAKQVAGRLGEIASGVSKVSDIVAEIASGAQAQSTGLEQVTKAVTEMDKVTQQNAASAEESSSAASELSGQAEELAAMVAEFQIASQVRTNTPISPRRTGSLPALSVAPAVRSSQRTLAAAPAGHLQLPRNSASARTHDAFPMEEASDLKEF